MESFLIKAAQLIAALAFLVVIHELGHYTFARIFGIRVEKFYLFFNPWFSLAKWKPRPRRDGRPSWRDTEYGIGWLPLGGYCKIAGMIDESMDKEQMQQPAQPWEFRSKPAWQRLLVMLGGVLFNFILAIIIYAAMAFAWGEKYIPLDRATEGMDYVQTAKDAGFRDGDVPLLADGRKIDASEPDFMYRMLEAKHITVLRNKRDTVVITLPEGFLMAINKAGAFMEYRVPVYVDRVVSGEPAAKAGLQAGDHIVAIDTVATPSFSELSAALKARGGKPSTLTVERGSSRLSLPVTPTDGGKLGFQLKALTDVYEPVVVTYGMLQSVPVGIKNGTGMLTNYVSSMKHVFTREGAQSLGGFGAIGDMFPDRWSWYSFWSITAFLSVALAFMNIIPIPGLDGGHVLFLLVELVTRRKVPERFLEIAQMIGMAFLLLLLLYANGNDIFRAFFK